jgi:uncharacterized protein YkwD
MLVLPAALPAQSAASSSSSNVDLAAALNAYRASVGLAPVVADAELTAAAMAHAQDMALYGYFSHTGRDGSTSGTRAGRAGCSFRAAAENIAMGQTSESQVLQNWADSAGHRRNMLNRSYARFGLGRAGNYWVLMFADQC